MLKAVSLSKHYDTELLFEGVDLILNAALDSTGRAAKRPGGRILGVGDRVGLVGPNGAGKSTLLRLLVGDERPTTGHVTLAPGTTVGYFAQQVAHPDTTVGAFLREGLGDLPALADRLTVLEERLAQADLSALAEYGEVQERWTQRRGWSAAARVAEIRQRLNLVHLADDALLREISGGEQARLTLGRLLLTEPDLLILDEPTNHLDVEGIAWLGTWLSGFGGAVLVVSHDRAFLDRTVTRIIELDGIHDRPQLYEGGYSAYRVEKANRWQRYLLDYEAQSKQRRRWEADIAATKDHALGVELTVRSGAEAPHLRRIAKKVAKKAIVRERRLRRQMDSVRWLAEPQTRPPLTLAFPGTASADDVVLRAASVSVKLGGRLILDDLDLAVRGGERILLSGRNGTGKTTLLRVLAGEREPDTGSVTGDAVLLPQTHDALRTATTVMDYFRSRVPVYADDAEALLDAYMFPAETWNAPLRTLSAGELRRLLLAVMVNSGSSALLLDEPTNYLDFDSLDVVEEALRAYQGTLIMVTHDPVFADRVGVTRELGL